MSFRLKPLEILRMVVMTVLSFLSLEHLIYLVYAYMKNNPYIEYFYVDVILVIVAGSLYLTGLLSSLFPRSGIARSTGLKFFVLIAFLVIILQLGRGIKYYRDIDSDWEDCNDFHGCVKDLIGAFIPALIYNICLLFFISIDAFINWTKPKQDQLSLPMMYNNNELNR